MPPQNANTPSILPSEAGDRYGTGDQHVVRLGGGDLHVIPVIFVPGVMGTRLKNTDGEKVWDPDDLSFMLFEYGLWTIDPAAKKEKVVGGAEYDPDFLLPDDDDLLHNSAAALDMPAVAAAGDVVQRGDELSSIFIDLGVMQFVFDALKEMDVIDKNASPEEVDDWKGWTDLEAFLAKREQAEVLFHKAGATFLKGLFPEGAPSGDPVGKLAEVIERGWGSLYWGGYGPFIRAFQERVKVAVRAGVEQRAQGLPEDEINRLAGRLQFPIYGFGYNWTNSCRTSGEKLATYIDDVIARYQDLSKITCEEVILVTHSMGGLVARSACKIHGAEEKVGGVIHGVQPTLGSAAMHWRAKCGFRRASALQLVEESDLQPEALGTVLDGGDEAPAWFGADALADAEGAPKGAAALLANVKGVVSSGVLGSDGREVTALAGNLPGLLELAPTHQYRTNAGETAWLKVVDETGKAADREVELPEADSYDEVHAAKLDEQDFWPMVKPALLVPEHPDDTAAIEAAWERYKEMVDQARAFHEDIEDYAHPRTFNFYGGGDPVRRMGSVLGFPGESEELLFDTSTADTVVYRIRPFTWEDLGGNELEDTINRALEGDLDPEATLESFKSSVGTPEQMAQDASQLVTGQLTGTGQGQAQGGNEALAAGQQALGSGKEALEAAKGAYQTAQSGFQEVLKATQEAVQAAQQVVQASQATIEATQAALETCVEAVERLADTIDNAEAVLEDILETVEGHLEQAVKEEMRRAYAEALERAREAVGAARKVLSDAIAAAGRAAQEATQAARAALKAGKKAFSAGEKALQDALATGQNAAEKIEDAAREALEAAEAALEAGREALQATRDVLDQVREGLREVLRTALQVASHATEALDAIEEVLHDERQRPGGDAPLAELLRAIEEVLLAIETARATVEAGRAAVDDVLTAVQKAEEALQDVAKPVKDAFAAAEKTMADILAASEQAMERVVESSKQRLQEARDALAKGKQQMTEHANQAIADAREALESGWGNLGTAVEDGLASLTSDLEDRPEDAIERVRSMLERAVRDALMEYHQAVMDTLTAIVDAVAEAQAAAEDTVAAGENALAAAQRVADIGADALNDLLHASEEAGSKAGQALGDAGQAAQAASQVRPEQLGVDDLGADVQATGTSPASLPAYPEKYQDGRVHPRYKRGGFEAYFATDDGTVLKAVLEDPTGVGDSTVPLHSGQALAGQEKLPEEYALDYDPEQAESLFAPLMHEPAYKSTQAQTFTIERVVHLFAAKALTQLVEEG